MINKCPLMNSAFFFSKKRRKEKNCRRRAKSIRLSAMYIDKKTKRKKGKLITENSILIDVKIFFSFYCLSGSLMCRARSFNIPKARIRFRPNNFAKVSSQLTYCLLTGSFLERKEEKRKGFQ